MNILMILFLVTYDVFYFLYFKELFSLKRRHWLLYAFVLAVNIGAVSISESLHLYQISVLIITGSIVLAFLLLFRVSWPQILYAGSIYTFSFYSSRGIVASVYSLILNKSMETILQREAYYTAIFFLSVLLSILFNLFFRRFIMPDATARYLAKSKELLKFAVIYLIIQLVYLMLINDGRFFEINHAWFSALYLISCIISKVGLQFVFNYIVKLSTVLEYEIHTRQLQEQLERQIRHYRSYQRYTESFRTFKHDYKNMMASVKTLLRNEEYEKAIRMLDYVHDTMQKDVQILKTYSNNIMLDAILQDAANYCEEKGISFSALAHLPKEVSLTELDIVRIFSNVIDNAMEACEKLSGNDRFIKITSSGNQEWAIIEAANSYSGGLFVEDGELQTQKENRDYHGLGLKIIRDTIEGLGGLMFIDPGQEEKVFKIKLCFPKA